MKTCLVVFTMVIALVVIAEAEEVKYTTHIKKIFDAQCAGCHGGDAPEYGDFKKAKEKFVKNSKGPKMDSYAHLVSYTGWPDTGAIMRRLDDGRSTKDGKPGNMYQHLGADEKERQDNLRLFKAWVGNWILKRFSELSKEDLAGISVRY